MEREVAPGVVELLREQLLTGALPPGTRLTQGDLGAKFGVSRMPIRQALQTMTEEVAIASAWRTPIGTFMGSPGDVSAKATRHARPIVEETFLHLGLCIADR